MHSTFPKFALSLHSTIIIRADLAVGPEDLVGVVEVGQVALVGEEGHVGDHVEEHPR